MNGLWPQCNNKKNYKEIESLCALQGHQSLLFFCFEYCLPCMRALYRVMKMFHILIWVLALWVFTIFKTYQGTSSDRQRAWWTLDGGLWHCTGDRDQNLKKPPRKGNGKKAKWLSEEALQIAVKRREVKSKGEKEIHTHLNAEFQRIARRDRAFLSDQGKEIEENNRMEKTRDLFRKIRDATEHLMERWVQ